MQKIKKIFQGLVLSILLAGCMGVLKDVLSSILSSFETGVFLSPLWMESWGCGSSSSVPQSEPSAPDPTPPEEPAAPEPPQNHPLLDDNTRRAELDERAGFHLANLPDAARSDFLDAQVIIDKAIEKALLSDGYSRDELNLKNKRNEIRSFLFYPRGKLLPYKKYLEYVQEVELGTHRSDPYQRIMKALRSSELELTHKPIKRWELNKYKWR